MEPLARWASEVGEGAGLSPAAGRRDRAWEQQTEGVGSPGHFLGFRCRKCSTCLSVTPTPGLVRETWPGRAPPSGAARRWDRRPAVPDSWIPGTRRTSAPLGFVTPGPGAMALKPEKRVASSVFITLAPPRRDEAVTEEVRRVSGEAWHGRPREPSVPLKAPGRPWSLPGRAAPPRLSNGGSLPPPPALDSEDPLGDLDLPPPPPVAFLCPRPAPASLGASLASDLEQLHLHLPPPPPPQAPAEPAEEEELPPPPEEPLGIPDSEVTADICAFCHKTVSPRELAVEAMKKQYHAQCFTCRTCRRQLAGQSFYQKDGRPLCEPCYQDTLEKCGRCGAVVWDNIIRALGQAFHPACFTCVSCARRIGAESFALDGQDQVYCLDDFYRKFAPVCSVCEKPIVPRDGKDAFKIECMGRNFHENCYRCEDCSVLLSVEPTEQGCYPLDDRLFCKPCHVRRSAAGCC